MNKSLSILLCLLSITMYANPTDSTIIMENTPIGFASVNAMGQNGTTGGAGGDTIYISNGADLYTFLDDRKDPNLTLHLPPKIIVIQGKITSTKKQLEIKQTYNLTFIGKGNDAAFEGTGLFVKQSYNIIIRNIEFRNAPIDGVAIQYPESHHVWVDHCTFTDSPDLDTADARHDGALDIAHGSSYITVSWCHFTNHTKTCLLGHDDGNSAEDSGKLKTTYHHNWFDNSGQRHPRVRFAECHVYNNYYLAQGRMLYGIASTVSAKVLVEGCFFQDLSFPSYCGYAESPAGELVERNNVYLRSGAPQILGTAFDPTTYYQYAVTDPNLLPVIIPQYAGSGKLITDVEESKTISSPKEFSLLQNYPNPFNPSTVITYQVANFGQVLLKVYDVMGNEIRTLINREMQAGSHEVLFDANGFPSGLYVCVLHAGNYVQTKKMLLVK